MSSFSLSADIKAVCLMGPTASGKTALALQLCEHYPFEIISVDSALVYRGMNVGTAKPKADELSRAPHHLIDLCDPTERYSAGNFVKDAVSAMQAIHERGKVPLLVGGTMLYFKHLLSGSADLPPRDSQLRTQIEERAQSVGWLALHQDLALIDPVAAARIHPNDPQRIQRALEVFHLTGTPISEWQRQNTSLRFSHLDLVLEPDDRAVLHRRIACRLDAMWAQGLVEEVRALRSRYALNDGLPSMRCVGYRQVWQHLEGELDYEQMQYRALVATRQLAKRQLTWLRQWPEKHSLSMASSTLKADVLAVIKAYME